VWKNKNRAIAFQYDYLSVIISFSAIASSGRVC